MSRSKKALTLFLAASSDGKKLVISTLAGNDMNMFTKRPE